MPGRGGAGRWTGLLLAAVLVFILTLLLHWTDIRLPEGDQPRVLYLAALLALLLAGLVGRLAMPPRSALRWAVGQIVVWIGIGLALVAGFSYRSELRDAAARIVGELMPAQGRPVTVAESQPTAGVVAPTSGSAASATYARSMRFNMASDGQFHVEALIGASTVRFVLDTGASDVMLCPADARRLGFDPDTLTYNRMYRTANGTVRGARVILPAIDIGPIRVIDVDASVLEADTDVSLLGMSFLSRLSSFQVDGSSLTLVQ